MMSRTLFTGKLRAYQEEAHLWQEAHPHSILADKMGLGKTRPTIATLANHLPALVVCPTYLTNQWFDILCETLPLASVSLPEGTHQNRQQQLSEYADVRVVNIEMLRTYDMPQTNTLIVDEAHHIRGREAKQSVATRKLAWKAERVHFLTATPFYKADEDIWHLLHCLDPHKFSSYWNFIREWYTVNWNAAYAPHIYGVNRKKREAFNALVSTYMLLRDYEDVGRELPELITKNITFDLPTPIRVEYQRLKQHWQLAGQPVESVGEVYCLLRQLTMCHKKVEAIRSIVEDVPPNESVLIYTWYRESAHTLAKAFTAQGDAIYLLTGDTPPSERAHMLQLQKTQGRPRVIIATIEALQEGVNLEHIKHVVYAEETYVRGKHDQTLARAHRDRGKLPTSGAPTIVYYVRARKTIDERIPIIRQSRGTAGNKELVRQLAAS